MPNRLIVTEDQGRLSFILDRGLPQQIASAEGFTSPFAGEELEDLRWYVEDYLGAPYAVWEDRGAEVDMALADWGKSLFNRVFGTGQPGRDAYIQLTVGQEWELWLASKNPAFLGLPWELMCDPEGDKLLAFSLAGINRTLPDRKDALEVGAANTLRVLMVIARPKGDQDAGYRAVARPLFDKLDAVAGKVEVELCRPPTFARLKALLAEAKTEKRPFHILHFDGHGTFGVDRRGEADPLQFKAQEQGFLLFEGASDAERLVSAAAFGEVIDEAGVPLVVFNACRSGQLGSEVGPEATVATRLMQSGTAAVVAMSYSVYVRAAAEFMAAFYEALFEGEPVTRAVARGRRRLRDRPLRPSPKGDLPLKDWCVPVHYGRREVSFPTLKREVSEVRQGISLDGALDRVAASARADAEAEARDPFAPAGGRFFGRDREFYRLEQAIADHSERPGIRHPVVLIQGQGGSGKTELAKAYARWLAGTGWADGVFFHSFEPGVATFGLDGLVSEVGLAIFGTEFALKTKDQDHRAAVVVDVLRKNRLVLVLDNFESARSMPDRTGATPPLDDAEAERLRGFLAAASEGARSLVLITSRSDERWLAEESDGSKVRMERLELGGLSREEASEYADHLLADKPQAASGARRKKPSASCWRGSKAIP